VDLLARRAAGRPDVHAALGVVVQQRRGHLAAPRVLNAHEQNLGNLLGDGALNLAQRAQAFPRKTVHEQRHEVLQPRALERLQRLRHVSLDGLGRERAGELSPQRFEALLQMAARDEVDIEFPQLGGHRSSPLESPASFHGAVPIAARLRW
jgi:hypothetical protein